jgi:hypothetical protein
VECSKSAALAQLGRSRAAARSEQARQKIIDAILLANCLNHRIGSLTGIEIHPGETDQPHLSPVALSHGERPRRPRRSVLSA